MVRLKVRVILLLSTFSFKFQFHYGTIKSLSISRIAFSTSVFQFHYGTIKSFALSASGAMFLYFNSTMVRLKDFRYRVIRNLLYISIPLWYD